MPYFLVPDCEAAVRKAAALGGGAAVPTTQIPHVGTFAVLRDPLGAHFSVIAMAAMPEGA
jgi:predicted enzyme related to lactoylglutathione lyase